MDKKRRVVLIFAFLLVLLLAVLLILSKTLWKDGQDVLELDPNQIYAVMFVQFNREQNDSLPQRKLMDRDAIKEFAQKINETTGKRRERTVTTTGWEYPFICVQVFTTESGGEKIELQYHFTDESGELLVLIDYPNGEENDGYYYHTMDAEQRLEFFQRLYDLAEPLTE